mgnify:CR=1 FL=1
MAETKRIKTALVSVFHKDGLDALLKKLHDEGVKFLSTGGTQKFIEELGLSLPGCGGSDDLSFYFRWAREDVAS